jgi:hypothetical protein
MSGDNQVRTATGKVTAREPVSESVLTASASIDTLSAIHIFRESDAETRELIRQIIANNERLDRVRARQQWAWLTVGGIISFIGLIGGLSLAFASHPAAGAFVTVGVLLGLASAYLRRGEAGPKPR